MVGCGSYVCLTTHLPGPPLSLFLHVDGASRAALRQPVPVESVAKGMVFLVSQAWSGHVTGQILSVDSGKNGKVLWKDRSY